MNTVLLKEISTIKGGKRIPKGLSFSNEKTNHPYIRVVDMENYSRIQMNDSICFIDNEVHEKISRYIVHEKDIILSNVGTVGVVSMIGETLDGANLTENCVKITVDEKRYIPEFVFYYLLSYMGQKQINYSIVGSVQPKLPIYNIEKIKLPCVSLKKQSKLVEVLNIIHDCKHNNDYLMRTLEEYTKLLHYKWFVEYNYPDTNGLPYKESGGKMKEVHGKCIPNDFNISTVGNECKVIMGQSPPSETYNFEGEGLPFYQGVVDFGFKFPTVSKWCNKPTRIATVGDVLLSVRAPVGRLNIAIEECCIGRGVSSISLEGTKNYYASCELERGMKRLKKQGNGTVFDAIKKDDILGLKFLVPSDGLVERFEEEVGAYQEKILNATKENKLLEETRDLLIKKLIK